MIRQRRADAGLGWLTSRPEALPDPIDVMTLGGIRARGWIPAAVPVGDRELIDLDELADMDVIHGPRRTSPAPTTRGGRYCAPASRASTSPTLRSGTRCR